LEVVGQKDQIAPGVCVEVAHFAQEREKVGPRFLAGWVCRVGCCVFRPDSPPAASGAGRSAGCPWRA
jgi:hypothetical protein